MSAKPYSPQTLARHWDCSPKHIRDLCKAGELPFFTLGKLIRIPAAAVEAYERGTLCGSDAEKTGTGTVSVQMESHLRSEQRTATPPFDVSRTPADSPRVIRLPNS